MIYAIVSFGVFVVGVFFVWLTALNNKIATLQDAFDNYVTMQENIAEQAVRRAGKDILIRYNREQYWLTDGEKGCEYISYGQAIRLITEHLGLNYEYVEGTKGYTRLVPKPEPEEEKKDE